MPNRAGTRRERDKKNFVLDTVSSDPSWSVPKNNSKKIQKLKNIILALFPSKPSRDRPRKRQKIFRFEFHSNPTQARAFSKK